MSPDEPVCQVNNCFKFLKTFSMLLFNYPFFEVASLKNNTPRNVFKRHALYIPNPYLVQNVHKIIFFVYFT